MLSTNHIGYSRHSFSVLDHLLLRIEAEQLELRVLDFLWICSECGADLPGHVHALLHGHEAGVVLRHHLAHFPRGEVTLLERNLGNVLVETQKRGREEEK